MKITPILSPPFDTNNEELVSLSNLLPYFPQSHSFTLSVLKIAGNPIVLNLKPDAGTWVLHFYSVPEKINKAHGHKSVWAGEGNKWFACAFVARPSELFTIRGDTPVTFSCGLLLKKI